MLTAFFGVMPLEEDKELESIRRKKLRGLMKNSSVDKSDEEQTKSIVKEPVEVTDSTFADFIQSNPLVIVDCWAPWCAPCRMVAPIIEEMARDYSGKILFAKLNVDQNMKVTMQYKIMSIPTLLIFKDGKLVDQIIGAMPRRILEDRITRYL